MKLNPECVRDILLSVEAGTGKVPISANQIISNNNSYARDEVLYHISQCNMNGYFYGYMENVLGEITIEDLSPKGHDLLQKIREPQQWEKIKKALLKVGGSITLGIIENIAANLITASLF